ncbi:MAG: hypothetical protein NTV49_16155 [Kiritimatiellaeota bacterium]|nr:hypothetical protein [Kiritimatiellota bacterium]
MAINYGLTEQQLEIGAMMRAFSKDRVLRGDKYILNGTKQWITTGGEAETYSSPTRCCRNSAAWT